MLFAVKLCMIPSKRLVTSYIKNVRESLKSGPHLYVSDKDNEHEVTLDTFFSDKPRTPLFIKMDIEGAERYALQGSKRLFEQWPIKFAICLYHIDDDKMVPPILRQFGCKFIEQCGFFIGGFRHVLARGNNAILQI